MEEKKKYGWTARGILGFVFIPMGLVYLFLGLLLWFFKAGENPEDPRIFLLVFGIMGLIFLAAGLVCLGSDLHRRALQRRAFLGGYYVTAKIAGLKENSNIKLKRRFPLVLECHYTDPDTGIVHVWYSRYLYVDVRDLLQSDEVPVYIDRLDSRIGFVDIDAVLPRISVHR